MEVDQRNQWEKYLLVVEYAYNNIIHTTSGKAPFEIIEGRPKLPLIIKTLGNVFAIAMNIVKILKSLSKD